ncbi:PRC-barrel domain-containing protein [Histidinibacterium aquaticum]|nr:PRC-barrel domain-containing protein [Histidinibacterium aquaticum]
MLTRIALTTSAAALATALGTAGFAESHTSETGSDMSGENTESTMNAEATMEDTDGANSGEQSGETMTASNDSTDEYPSGTMDEQSMENIIRVSEILDGDVYTLQTYDEAEWADMDSYDGVNTEWDQIGNITDVALSANGEVTGLVVETGGFLDIGDSHVLVNLDDVKLVNPEGDVEAYSYVTRMTEEELQNLENVGENWW